MCPFYFGSTYQPGYGQRKDIHLGLSRAVISPDRYARRGIGKVAEDNNNRDIAQLPSKVPSFFCVFFFEGSYEKLYKGTLGACLLATVVVVLLSLSHVQFLGPHAPLSIGFCKQE